MLSDNIDKVVTVHDGCKRVVKTMANCRERVRWDWLFGNFHKIVIAIIFTSLLQHDCCNCHMHIPPIKLVHARIWGGGGCRGHGSPFSGEFYKRFKRKKRSNAIFWPPLFKIVATPPPLFNFLDPPLLCGRRWY